MFPRHRRFFDSIKIDACPELPPYILKRLEEVCTAGRRRTVYGTWLIVFRMS